MSMAIIVVAWLVAACLPSQAPVATNLAEWTLDPATLPIADDAMTLHGYVREIACASGRSPDGRIVLRGIDYRADAIVITFGVVPLPGDQDCPQQPAVPGPVRACGAGRGPSHPRWGRGPRRAMRRWGCPEMSGCRVTWGGDPDFATCLSRRWPAMGRRRSWPAW